jgi:hypothetical protein
MKKRLASGKWWGLALTCAAIIGCSSDDDDAPGTSNATGGTNPAGGSGTAGSNGNLGGNVNGSGGNGGVAVKDACGTAALDLTNYEKTSSVVTTLSVEKWGSIHAMYGRGSDLYVLGASELSVIRGNATTREVLSTTIPELPNGYYSDSRSRLVVDETHAYFATTQGIARIDLASGAAEALFEGAGEARTSDLWLVDGEVLFALYGGEATGIYRVPSDGSAEPTLITNVLEPLGFGYADGAVYSGTSSYWLSSVPIAGGTPTRITDYTVHILPDYQFTTVSGDRLVWSDSGDLLSCPLSDCSSPTKLGPMATDGLVAHGARLYWQTDSLGWVTADGSSCRNLVYGDFPDNVELWSVTDDYLYLAGSFGDAFAATSVIRMPVD